MLGIAVFIRTKDPVPFEQDELLLAEELVSRAALSLDNARRYTLERTAALALQRNLLPHRVTGPSPPTPPARRSPSSNCANEQK